MGFGQKEVELGVSRFCLLKGWDVAIPIVSTFYLMIKIEMHFLCQLFPEISFIHCRAKLLLFLFLDIVILSIRDVISSLAFNSICTSSCNKKDEVKKLQRCAASGN